ncbi:hypothetical protein R3P38DRAFT_3433930 [Favolaschia claudopus]|uniref:Uncharacterized protein n=1 Tax=Favolaschia claudopus TaxID=2862362 RepID=A0AAW0D1E5_9AGAR
MFLGTNRYIVEIMEVKVIHEAKPLNAPVIHPNMLAYDLKLAQVRKTALPSTQGLSASRSQLAAVLPAPKIQPPHTVARPLYKPVNTNFKEGFLSDVPGVAYKCIGLELYCLLSHLLPVRGRAYVELAKLKTVYRRTIRHSIYKGCTGHYTALRRKAVLAGEALRVVDVIRVQSWSGEVYNFKTSAKARLQSPQAAPSLNTRKSMKASESLQRMQAQTNPDSDRLEPRLPLDLERLLFETAALANPGQIPTLVLVSHRIRAWLQPLLYQIIYLATHPTPGFPVIPFEFLCTALEARDPLVCNSVQHVLIENILSHPSLPDSGSFLHQLITRCPNITNVYSFWLKGFQAELASLVNLRHLSIEALDRRSQFDSAALAPLIFPTLTHLEFFDIQDRPPEPALGTQFFHLRQLTHIAFSSATYAEGLYPRYAHLPQLCCIVVFALGSRSIDETPVRRLAMDERFVYIRSDSDHVADWFDCARGGGGFWARAEAFIAARRAGDIDLGFLRTYTLVTSSHSPTLFPEV